MIEQFHGGAYVPYTGTSSKHRMCPIRRLTNRAPVGHPHEMRKNSIRVLRELRDMSQEALAHAIGTTGGYFGRLERGERRLNMDHVYKLAEALKVPPYQILMTPDELRAARGLNATPAATTTSLDGADDPFAQTVWYPGEEEVERLLGAVLPFLLAGHGSREVLQEVVPEIVGVFETLSQNPGLSVDDEEFDKMLEELIGRIGVRTLGTRSSKSGN